MKYLTVSTVLRVITAIVLFNALMPQPYSYFLVLRFAVCFTSAYLIYVAITTKNYAWTVVSLFLIVLFNPFWLPPIKRNVWVIIDVIAAIVLIVSVFLVGEKLDSTKSLNSTEK